jgi:hypothetical protein
MASGERAATGASSTPPGDGASPCSNPARRSTLVLTNVEAEVDDAVVVGPSRLSRVLDERAELRLRVPSVLGIRDLRDLVAAEVATRSTADVGAAMNLARVFVPTEAYAGALDVLAAHHFAVLTGPPEMGKTAIARTIALAQLTYGWEVHECIRPEQLWRAFARDRRQVFVADDAFGSTEYRPEAAERWALELDRVLRAMDERHWLIWTSRPAPLKAGLRRVHREHGVERFPRPAEVQVDAAALGVDEKVLILFRHSKAARLPLPAVRIVRAHGWDIVSHPHFTPERIRRFVSERLPGFAGDDAPADEVAAAVATEIREPTTAMAASFAALAPEHQAVLVALLDAPPEPVPERALVAAVRRHSDTGFPKTPGELVDRLTDHFVRVVPPASVAWVHPSWRDLVIDQLSDDDAARLRFLDRCGLDGVVLAVSVAGGATGERLLPLLRKHEDWDAVSARVARLAPELDDPAAIRLLESLGAALGADLPDGARAEVEALAALTLERTKATWDRKRAPLSVAAVEAWFRLAMHLPHPPHAPTLAPTWIELVPSEPIDLSSRPELSRFDECLALVEILSTFAPRELERFGFPHQQKRVFAQFVEDVATRPPDEADELLERILLRIRRLVPAYRLAAADAALSRAARSEPWFEVRFETRPRRPEPSSSDRYLVERVLRDLG